MIVHAHHTDTLSCACGCVSRHQSPSVLVPALRTVGNIVTGDDMQTQIIINCGALPCLLNLLQTTHKKSIKKEACWTLSNITAGTKDQIQAVFDAGIIPPLVHLLATAEFDIKKESAWAISNATSGGTREQIKYLVSAGCIRPLCDLLTCTDTRIVSIALEGLENILKVTTIVSVSCQMCRRLNAISALKKCKSLAASTIACLLCKLEVIIVAYAVASRQRLMQETQCLTSVSGLFVVPSNTCGAGLCRSVSQTRRWQAQVASIPLQLSLMRQKVQTRLSSFRVILTKRSMRRLSVFWRHSLMWRTVRLRIWHLQSMPTIHMHLELVLPLPAGVPLISALWHSEGT